MTAKRCAFLTLADSTGWVIDDELAYEPLADLGWSVEAVPWNREGLAWDRWDAVVIRSTWDYTSDPEAFLRTLRAIEAAGTPLFNHSSLVAWNLRKTYLRELEERGVPIVPTLWIDALRPGRLPELYARLGSFSAVIKPVVGASAKGIFVFDDDSLAALLPEIEEQHAGCALMLQPFVETVAEEGEVSLFFFGGGLSHAVRKTPKERDFRVQEEHGGTIRAIEPDAPLRAAGDRVMRALGEAPLYARIDLVRHDGELRLMELELIEPALYFRTDPGAAPRFAAALNARFSA